MKKIDISTPMYPNTFSEVDDSDFRWIAADKWYAHERHGTLYARRNIQSDGKTKVLYMHTAIIGKVEGKMVDHRDRDGLNNRRRNLRHCTNAENGRNRGIPSNNKSGYKGVSWEESRSKWKAQLMVAGKYITIGRFTCLVKAAKAYDAKAKELFGEFACLNFP